MFLKLKDDSSKYQVQSGIEIELVKQFIEYFYYEREHKRDSHDRIVIVVKYGKDFFRLKKDGNDFLNWYNS